MSESESESESDLNGSERREKPQQVINSYKIPLTCKKTKKQNGLNFFET